MEGTTLIRALLWSMSVATVACGPAAVVRPDPAPVRAEPPATEDDADSAATASPSAPPLALHEIPLPGDRRSFPHALAEVDGDVALLTTAPDGIARTTVDLDARSVAAGAPLVIDRFPQLAVYDRTRDLFWWTTTGEQERLPPQGRQRLEHVVTRSIIVGNLAGLRAEIDRCPEPPPPVPPTPPRGRRRGASPGTGRIGTVGIGAGLGGHADCNHEVEALLPVSSGLLVGGSLSTGTPFSPRPWLGIVSTDGTLIAEATLEDAAASVDGRVVALTSTDAGVFALVASGFGSSRHATLVLLREGTVERIGSATLATRSQSSRPRFGMAPAPGGGVFVLVPIAPDMLVLAEVARDGTIIGEQPITGVWMSTLATTDLSARGGVPWLSIVDSRGARGRHLVLARIDASTGAASESHDLVLPHRFEAARTLATERGYVLAGHVDLARPVAVWIPLPPTP